jgi:hypothetical protein
MTDSPSRRSVLTALAAVPVAGVPALAGNSAIGASLGAVIARHKAAVAAEAACRSAYESGGDGDRYTVACRHEDDVSLELARMPCASDAEFLEKLKYVLARDIAYYGDPDSRYEFGHTVAAVAQHFDLAREDAGV